MIEPFPPDHPIFKRGFSVQPSISTKLSGIIPAQNSPAWSKMSEDEKKVRLEIQDFLENQLPQEVREQMGAEPLSDPTATSASSTGQTPED